MHMHHLLNKHGQHITQEQPPTHSCITQQSSLSGMCCKRIGARVQTRRRLGLLADDFAAGRCERACRHSLANGRTAQRSEPLVCGAATCERQAQQRRHRWRTRARTDKRWRTWVHARLTSASMCAAKPSTSSQLAVC